MLSDEFLCIGSYHEVFNVNANEKRYLFCVKLEHELTKQIDDLQSENVSRERNALNICENENFSIIFCHSIFECG